MPRTRSSHTATIHVEPEQPDEPEDKVDLDDNETEEEVEYEEVEEEVEEEEEEVEEEEVEEIEEVEEAETEQVTASEAGKKVYGHKTVDVDESKHDELLSLPPHGSEIYIGGFPNDASEKELKRYCESVGEVTEVRMMKGKDTSGNKGYAFVTFKTKELASEAIKDLSNKEFKRKKIKCSRSQAKNKLFIGDIPRGWIENDMEKAVTKVGPGVVKVELIKDPQTPNRNRGFAFVEYYNHACAEYSRKKMSTPEFKLDSKAPTVSWADPRNGETSSTPQVKAIYVKNLPKNVTQDQLKKLFERHGEITKIVLPPAKSGHEKRYGFVHFKERSMAMKALKNTEKYEMNGDVLDCSLAKPPSDNKAEGTSNAQKGPLLPNHPAQVRYGMLGGAYGALAPGFGQPMIYGRGHNPAGMAMVPIYLPDGRVGYVLQQPGVPLAAPVPHHHPGGSKGNHSNSGTRNNQRGRGGDRFRPY